MGWEHTRRITMTAMRKNEELSAKEAGANTFSKENVVPPLPYSAFQIKTEMPLAELGKG